MGIDLVFFLELFIVLSMIAIGARYGGIGLGVAGGLGMCILVLVFGLKPASLPSSVVFIILAVITCVGVLQSAGGLDLLVKIAEKMLRKKPHMITFMGPFVAALFSVFCGTTYVAFSIYPVIAEVAAQAKIRPERPLSVSVIAAGMGVVASPMSAATAGMLGILSASGFGLFDILKVSTPAFFIGVFMACVSVYKRGKELEQDPEFLKKVESKEYEFISNDNNSQNSSIDPAAKKSLIVFSLGIIAIISLGTFTDFLPHYDVGGGKLERLSTPNLIQMLMLATACFIMLVAKVPTNKLCRGSVFTSGLIGIVGVFGISWMSSTFFETYDSLLKLYLSDTLRENPRLFGFVLFVFSSVIFSPSTTVATLMPIGLALGINPAILVSLYPCVTGDFIVPGANQIACVSFDRTGTTKIGRFGINHSYIRPGFVLVITSTFVAYLLTTFVY